MAVLFFSQLPVMGFHSRVSCEHEVPLGMRAQPLPVTWDTPAARLHCRLLPLIVVIHFRLQHLPYPSLDRLYTLYNISQSVRKSGSGPQLSIVLILRSKTAVTLEENGIHRL
ncbi:uncharacterized protein LOC144753606 [Lissotriton helveticus]